MTDNTNDDTEEHPSKPPQELLDLINNPDEQSLPPNEITERLLDQYDNTPEDTIWIVEHPISTYVNTQVAREDTRMDAIEVALRQAREASKETGEPIKASLAHEQRLLTDTERVYDYIKCGSNRWRVIQGIPRDSDQKIVIEHDDEEEEPNQ